MLENRGLATHVRENAAEISCLSHDFHLQSNSIMAGVGSWSFRFMVAPKRTREGEAKWGQSPLETTMVQQVKWGQSPLGVHFGSRIIFALGLEHKLWLTASP